MTLTGNRLRFQVRKVSFTGKGACPLLLGFISSVYFTRMVRAAALSLDAKVRMPCLSFLSLYLFV